jgi:hypothetical protein
MTRVSDISDLCIVTVNTAGFMRASAATFRELSIYESALLATHNVRGFCL